MDVWDDTMACTCLLGLGVRGPVPYIVGMVVVRLEDVSGNTTVSMGRWT